MSKTFTVRRQGHGIDKTIEYPAGWTFNKVVRFTALSLVDNGYADARQAGSWANTVTGLGTYTAPGGMVFTFSAVSDLDFPFGRPRTSKGA